MAAPKCKVCDAKSETIRALELSVQVLTEMVNLQRSIPATPVPAAASSGNSAAPYPPLRPVDEPAPEIDAEEIADRLNNDPDLDEDTAERLLAQVQAFNSTVERE